MRKFIFPVTLFAILGVSCNKQNNINLEFTNPISIERNHEILQFTYDELEALIGPFREDMLPLFLDKQDTLTAQFIDYRGDVLPEEVLLDISLSENESRTVQVQWMKQSDYPEFQYRTSIHFAKHGESQKNITESTRLQTVKTEETSQVYQMEGPAWENEQVGFRNYFDLRNGMDIFGKKTGDMILEYVGLKEETARDSKYDFSGSYHEPSDWGMDILKVGNSLGAGAIALEFNDSLYRIGDNGNGRYEYLYEGPLKSEFRFSFPDWETNGKVWNITQYVSITAGKYCYKSTLFLDDKDDADASFVTGMVNKHSSEAIRMEAGDDHIAFVTFDQQAEDGSYLAMGIMVNRSTFIENGKTRDSGEGITETYYVKMETKPADPVEYRFYSFWEAPNPAFAELQNIRKIIDHDAIRLENPITYKVIN